MILCQFLFKPGEYDVEFHELDGRIDAFARSLPGFLGAETWLSPDGSVRNASYYFEDKGSVAQLARFPEHRLAKSQYQRWYDGYQIVVSEVTASYGDGALPHVTRGSNEA